MNTPIKLSSRLAALAPGFHHVSIKQPDQFPKGVKIALYPAPVGAGHLSFMQGDTHQAVAFLQHPQDVVVVHVKDAPATLLIVDYKRPECVLQGGVELNIQRLAPVNAPAAGLSSVVIEEKADTEQLVVNQQPFLPVQGVMASGRKFSASNGVVGSPEGTEAISAFAIDHQSLPPGVKLAYACKKVGSTEPDVATAPKMVGLSKVDLPITAVSFLEQIGEGGSYDLKGHVVFAGCPPLAIVSGKELSGPSGREVLVALRVSFVKKSDQPSNPPASVWHDPVVLKSKAVRSHKDPKAN